MCIIIIWCIVSATRSETDRIFCHFGHENQNFEKMKKMPEYIFLLHMCLMNEDHMMHDSWNIRCDRQGRQNCSSFWVIFCPFTPLTIWKTKILEKNEKNAWRYYHVTHAYHKSQSYDVRFLRYEVQPTEIFVILDHFLLCYALTTQKIKKIEKMKKTPGDIIISHMCTINNNHMHGYFDMKCDW